MSDITAFIAARLDEDEALANGVINLCRDTRWPWPPEQSPGRGGPALTYYLRHFSEHRQLREVAAKRAILALHQPRQTGRWDVCAHCRPVDPEFPDDLTSELWPCRTVRHVISVWAGYPGCDPAWVLA